MKQLQVLTPDQVLVVMVNFNQEAEINNVLGRLTQVHPKQHVVVVDDGSTDNSGTIAQTLGFQVLRHSNNLGVGAALRSGLVHASLNGYKAIAVMSSNGKIRPEELGLIIGPVIQGSADYTTGSRFMKGGASPGLSRFRRTAIPLFSLISIIFLKRYFSDITCGFRCYRINFLESESVNIHQQWLNRYEMEYYIHYWACRLGLCIVEVPVTIPYTHLTKGRQSKIPPITGWWSMVRPFVLLWLGLRK